jgi:hypothetical protein
MAVCPLCNAKVSLWKLCTLTNFNAITCINCNATLVANRTRNSLIGGVGAGIGAPLLLAFSKYGSFGSFLVAFIIWLIALALAASYFNKLEVKGNASHMDAF